MRLQLKPLESRALPATLDLAGGVLAFTDAGSEPNNLTVTVSGSLYSFNDSLTNVSLTAGAIAAGWGGNGTKTASGPLASVSAIEINVGGGTNKVNIRKLAANTPVTVNGDGGDTTVNLSSTAPVMAGSTAGILSPVTVNAGANTTLQVANYLGAYSADPIVVDADSITGLTPEPIHLSGWFAAINLKAPHGTPLSQYQITNAPTDNLTVS